MITEPVPVSPHDTPKPHRSHLSARSLRWRTLKESKQALVAPVFVTRQRGRRSAAQG